MGPQRVYTRYAFSAAATMIHSSGLETPAQVTNISLGGCRLATSSRPSLGMLVIVKIQIDAENFEAPANVVHSSENGVGLMFRNARPQSLLVLNKWIQRATAHIDVNETKEKKPYVPPRVVPYKPEEVPTWAKDGPESLASDPGKQIISTHKRILVADDDTSVRAIVRKGIEHRLGFVCEEAENGLEAIARAKEFKADLVIMDLAMPVMNGFEAAMVLQREMPRVPVVILSMYAHEQFGGTLANMFGVKAIIAKAEGMKSLLECVQKLLAV